MTVERFELVLLVAAIVALAARRTRVPYTVGLVVTGSLLASIGALPGIELTKEFIFGTLLPPLIFEAAISIHWKELRVNLLPVVALATGGVLIGGGVVASIMVAAEGWTWPAALAFGALIAATDPVSVIAMFKELKIGGRLRLLVEAESLLNDGVAAVAFAIALLAASGTSLSTGVVFVEVLKQAGGGLLCGAIVGGIVLFLAGRTTDHLVELTFSAVAAFGSFMLAEHFGCSGVLAGLVAGLMFGSLGHRGAISEGGQDAQNAFWEFAAFIANSVIFIVIGVGEHRLFAVMREHWPLILLGIGGSLLGRGVAVYSVSAAFRRSEHAIPFSFQHVLFWGGLRGALSLALALGLPSDFPHRTEIVAVTFGIVAFSVIVQGLTMPLLIRRMRVERASSTAPTTG